MRELFTFQRVHDVEQSNCSKSAACSGIYFMKSVNTWLGCGALLCRRIQTYSFDHINVTMPVNPPGLVGLNFKHCLRAVYSDRRFMWSGCSKKISQLIRACGIWRWYEVVTCTSLIEAGMQRNPVWLFCSSICVRADGLKTETQDFSNKPKPTHNVDISYECPLIIAWITLFLICSFALHIVLVLVVLVCC